jgi:hypothetical protein
MNAILKKLLYKEFDRNLIINEPDEFKEVSQDISATVHREVLEDKYEFIIVFSKKLEELKTDFEKVNGNLEENAIIWIAYPKGSSKKYKKDTDIKRDNLQPFLKEDGYEGVSLISIDDDWSAMRFRPVS